MPPRNGPIVLADTLDGLNAQKERVEADLAAIKRDIEAAKANHKAGIVSADPVWLARAESARRFIGADHQRICREQKRLAAKLATAERSLRDYFIDVCHERMSAEVFDALMGEAKDRKQSAA